MLWTLLGSGIKVSTVNSAQLSVVNVSQSRSNKLSCQWGQILLLVSAGVIETEMIK